LGFVNAERGGLAEGCAELGFRKTLVVETVASLVKDTVEGDHEVAFVVTGGHAGIARAEARAEGVSTGVEATRGGVEPDFWKKKLEEFLLIGAGVVASESFTGGWLRQGESFFGYGNEARAKFGKERSDVSG
jgi:predicted TIM-barrel enzyme